MITKNQFGVIYCITVFSCLWGIYLFSFKSSNPNEKYSFGECLFDYTYPMPIINRNNEIDYEKCLDGWSMNHFFIYFTVGLLFPREYFLVVFLSIACEIMEILGKSRGRLSDIIVNSSGYIVGSHLSSHMGVKIKIDDDSMDMLMPCMLLTFFVFYKIAKKRKKELKNIKIATWKE